MAGILEENTELEFLYLFRGRHWVGVVEAEKTLRHLGVMDHLTEVFGNWFNGCVKWQDYSSYALFGS